MASKEELGKKVLTIKSRINDLSETKNKLAGQLKSEKNNLAKLVESIKAKGYEPELKKLKEAKETKEKEFKSLVEKTEKELDELETKLSTIHV